MDDDNMERELVESAREGRPSAGAFLVSRYAPSLMGYCRSITPDLGDIDRELIVEFAIEKALRKIERYDPARGPFEPWLRTLVMFAAKDWRRNPARTVPADPTAQDGPLIAAVAPHQHQSAPTTTRLAPAIDALRGALPQLSVPDQVIIGLRDLEGRSIHDVATRLEITEAACRQRHHRAKARLIRLLKADPRTATLTGDDT